MGRAPVSPPGYTVIALDDDLVSKTHALLHLRDGVVALEDLGSTNGTMLRRGGETAVVAERVAVSLLPHDVVHIGRHRLELMP